MPRRRMGSKDVQLHSFLIPASAGGRGQVHAAVILPPVNYNGTHWIGGWVGTRAGLDILEKTTREAMDV